MEKQYGKFTTYGKFNYIEPNNVYDGYDVPIPLENLCLYVELSVEYNKNSYEESTKYKLVYKKVDGGSSQVSLYSGVKGYGNSKDIFLSTEGYGNYTIDNINNSSTSELFGVESIDIHYNTFYVPEVTIKFVDIKGAALHAAEELAHDDNGYLKQNNNITDASRFLSCFFTIPFPKFQLYLKGFYGEPVHYDLSCANFKSTFNSSTGNYNAVVTLVGYTFSLISDVTMCSLLLSPYSSYHGKSYWEQQLKNGRFSVDSEPMPTMQEIVNIWNNKLVSINIDDLITDINEEEKKEYEKWSEIINIINSLIVVFKDNGFEVNNNYVVITTIGHIKTLSDAFYNILGVYRDRINKIDNEKEHFEFKEFNNINNGWWRLADGNLLESGVTYSDETKIECYYINNGFVYYKEKLDNIIKQLEISKKDIESQYHQRIKESIGFTPTLYNLTKICFAHLETFLYMFDVIKGTNKSKCFPKCWEKNGEYLEEEWIGNVVANSEEEEFVNGFLSGMQELGVNDGEDEEDSKNYIYSTVGDIIGGSSWFFETLKNGYDVKAFAKRFMSIYMYISTRYKYFNDKNALKELGRLDVKALIKKYNLKYEYFKSDSLVLKYDNEGHVYDNYFKDVNIEISTYKEQTSNEYKTYFKVYEDINDNSINDVKIFDGVENGKPKYLELDCKNNWNSSLFQFLNYLNDLSAILVPYFEITNNTEIKPNGDVNIKRQLENFSRKYGADELCLTTKIYENNVKHLKITNNDLINLKPEKYSILFLPYYNPGSDEYEYDKPFFNFYGSLVHILEDGSIYGGEISETSYCFMAIKFLESFRFGKEGNPYNLINNIFNGFRSNLVRTVKEIMLQLPYYLYLLMGGVCYMKNYGRRPEDRNFNYDYDGFYKNYVKKNFEVTELFTYKNIDNEDVTFSINHNLDEDFIKRLETDFKNWVNGTFKIWFGMMKPSFVSYGSTMHVLVSKIGITSDNLFCYENKYFNDIHKLTKEITKGFFKTIVLTHYGRLYDKITSNVNLNNNLYLKEIKNKYFDCKFYYKNKEIRHDTYLQVNFYDYFDGFCLGWKEEFKNDIDKFEDENYVIVAPNHTIRDYLKLNIYRYLKQLWDRWISSGKNDLTVWNVNAVIDGEEKRVHFIDPSYNNVGNEIYVNLEKFVNLIQDCKEQKELPFLTFLSHFYQDNNCTLHNVQNFINYSNENVINNLFKPLSLTEIEEINPKSDLIVLFQYQAAATEEESFDITSEHNLPIQYEDKNLSNNMHIPAFGVTYGMQNQNYFTDVNVSMDTPNVTDASFQAIMQIVDENAKKGTSDTTVNFRCFGQDMYKVFSNHAYHCTVTMLGCATIQPLMYFQLNNVPLFRGTYIIHKVTHTVSANEMKTTFVGTKVSKYAMKKLTSSYYCEMLNASNGSETSVLIEDTDNTSTSTQIVATSVDYSGLPSSYASINETYNTQKYQFNGRKLGCAGNTTDPCFPANDTKNQLFTATIKDKINLPIPRDTDWKSGVTTTQKYVTNGTIDASNVENTLPNKMNVAGLVAHDFGDFYENRILGGKCARRVREAIEAALDKFNYGQRPVAACRYEAFFKFWGFTPVFFGFQKDLNGFNFINGDIIISAGLTVGDSVSAKAGHIQIYYDDDGKNVKKWYSGTKYVNADVYLNQGGRPFYVFRAVENQIPSTSPSQVLTSYKPSDEIKQYIKSKERLIYTVQLDNGQTAIGYGFKIDSKLLQYFQEKGKNIYIYGITKEDADEYFEVLMIYMSDELLQYMGGANGYWKNYNQDQLDAIFDVHYNSGIYSSPNMHKFLKEGNVEEALKEMNVGENDPNYPGNTRRRQENRSWFRGFKQYVIENLKNNSFTEKFT